MLVRPHWCEDIETLLALGLKALRTIVAEGGDPTAPARVLWRKYERSHNGVIDLGRSVIRETD